MASNKRASNKKLVGPFTLRIENGTGGWKNETFQNAHDVRQTVVRLIGKWRDEGLSQLRAGAYLFTDEIFSVSKSVKVFNADDKLVTHEILTAEF